MSEKQYETLIYEAGPITRIIHNEPEKRNALTGHFMLEFSDALKRFQRDRDTVVGVIVTGASRGLANPLPKDSLGQVPISFW